MQSAKALQRKEQDTSEFKQEAVRLVKSGKSALSVAKILNMPHQTLEHWLRVNACLKVHHDVSAKVHQFKTYS